MATFTYTKPTVGGSEDTWGTTLNANWDALGTFLGSLDSAELAVLDGITSSTAELNLLDGVTWTLADYNTLTATAEELNALDGVTPFIAGFLNDGNDTSARATLNAALDNPLTQAEVEDDTSTVFGQVSGQRLAQAGIVSFTDQEQQVGVGQTWQDVSASRATNTSYQNTTGKPIVVSVSGDPSSTAYFQVSADNVTFVDVSTFSSVVGPDGFGPTIVPDTHYYRVSGTVSLLSWAELR